MECTGFYVVHMHNEKSEELYDVLKRLAQRYPDALFVGCGNTLYSIVKSISELSESTFLYLSPLADDDLVTEIAFNPKDSMRNRILLEKPRNAPISKKEYILECTSVLKQYIIRNPGKIVMVYYNDTIGRLWQQTIFEIVNDFGLGKKVEEVAFQEIFCPNT